MTYMICLFILSSIVVIASVLVMTAVILSSRISHRRK